MPLRDGEQGSGLGDAELLAGMKGAREGRREWKILRIKNFEKNRFFLHFFALVLRASASLSIACNQQ